jgi:hypothetical protein
LVFNTKTAPFQFSLSPRIKPKNRKPAIDSLSKANPTRPLILPTLTAPPHSSALNLSESPFSQHSATRLPLSATRRPLSLSPPRSSNATIGLSPPLSVLSILLFTTLLVSFLSFSVIRLNRLCFGFLL